MNTKEIINNIFKDPKTTYELTEFENLGESIYDIVKIYPKTSTMGRDAGKTKYFMKSFAPFFSGKEEVQVFDENGKSNPEELVRQLWVYKLINYYGYKIDEIILEKNVSFGSEVNVKAADIVVYTDNTKQTPKIIIEVKKPKRKDGIEQLKSYLNAEGSPVGVWSNGSDKIILYRPYPADFNDTLVDLPRRGQEPKDVLEEKRTLTNLKKNFNFKKIVQDLEELVLADSGKDEFNEIFKLIFAKIWDEKEAMDNRDNQEIQFVKSLNPDVTYERINNLFKKACEEWPGIFKEDEDIELTKKHLQICIGPIEGVRLMGSNLRIMDDAFEYLLPTEAKKKKGQFFTPRHVVEMCVRMMNPKKNEFVMDPSCGSAGFLLHTMEWCYPAVDKYSRELRKHRYAGKYLWGIDFEERAAKTSRALMLIAGDGHTNIFGPDVSSIDPKTWYETPSGQKLMSKLIESKLTKIKLTKEDESNILRDDKLAWKYFDELQFDVILANPPFAGEIKDKVMLSHYELAKPALKRAKDKAAKEERDVLFIERILKFLKPGGRAAIVLPQGKFNNSSLAFIREWILRKARLLAVVGLHQNTFKPHTGTKTSVLFIKKYTEYEISEIEKVKQEVALKCPDYEAKIKEILEFHKDVFDIEEEYIPEDILEILYENFSDSEDGVETELDYEEGIEVKNNDNEDLETKIEKATENISILRNELILEKNKLGNLQLDVEELKEKQKQKIENIKVNWIGTQKELNIELKPMKEEYKLELKALKGSQKEERKNIKAKIKRLEKVISNAEIDIKKLTKRGKLELIIEDDEMLASLKEKWIDSEVSKKLDYPIFMAVSENSGKNNSGDYEYMLDEDGNIIEFDDGQPIINQDLVNFNLNFDDLKDINSIEEEKLCIAEAFVKFAKKHDFDFWRES
ncbi:N-6 DNA methylase [Clostridium thermobutyricum]|uniref:N-6 DNA methylase n=1 Tax=Clostridium thermobutyricum TaxID=29372 RepID=UPI002941D667|nr:N-6 DNA methylase [Clostridium thermobutyricum]